MRRSWSYLHYYEKFHYTFPRSLSNLFSFSDFFRLKPTDDTVFWLAFRVQLSRISLYLVSGNRLFRNDAYHVSVISINNTLYWEYTLPICVPSTNKYCRRRLVYLITANSSSSVQDVPAFSLTSIWMYKHSKELYYIRIACWKNKNLTKWSWISTVLSLYNE